MAKEYIVWAHDKTQPEWMETIIAETTDHNKANDIARKFEANGHKTRIMIYGGEAPNFIAALQTK